VRGRIIRKRIHVRIEHIQPSRCREDFLRRREENDTIKHEAKVKGGACPAQTAASRWKIWPETRRPRS
jgi:hypothetical protein